MCKQNDEKTACPGRLNLKEDIPPSEQWKVILLSVILALYTFMLFANVVLAIAGAALAVSDPKVPEITKNITISTAVFSLLWLLVLPVSALFGWFYPVYQAYKKNEFSGFVYYFLIMTVQFFVWIIISIGTPAINVGVISGVNVLLTVNETLGMVWIAASAVWYLLIVGSITATAFIFGYTASNFKIQRSEE